ncbi:MAG: helix-turn-helix domain-containing protein [Candidatus Buchananbacteria bacterium]|nr:helix-turn-helix domain-containing protein [Candidatus Buchananbacteria bacterium]
MAGFSYKKISNPLSLGQELSERRKKLGLELADVAHQINVSVKYLEAIEEGRYDQLPGEVYAKNFLRSYTKYIGCDYYDFLKRYQSEHTVYKKTKLRGVADFSKPVERISKMHLIVTPRLIRTFIVLLLVMSCFGYLGIKVKAIVTPPELVVATPEDNLKTDKNFIEVAGQIEAESTLEINGQQVLTDQDSRFNETIDLKPGVNIIEITAKKRHGQQTKVYRQVVLLGQEG